MMNKKLLIFAILLLAAAFFFFRNSSMMSSNSSIDHQLRIHVIEIEANRAATHAMKMSFEELQNKVDPYIHSAYKETYFDELKSAYETRNLVPYINEPPYEQYFSKVYSSDDNLVKQIYVKSAEISAIDASTQLPVKDTKSQIAKLYIFKKENDQWKVFAVNHYILSIDRNEPKQIIQKFTLYNDTPIEYEPIKLLNSQ